MRKYRTPYMREYRKRVETLCRDPQKDVETPSIRFSKVITNNPTTRPMPDALARSNAKYKRFKDLV